MIIKGLKWLLGIPSAEDREYNRLAREAKKEKEKADLIEADKKYEKQLQDWADAKARVNNPDDKYNNMEYFKKQREEYWEREKAIYARIGALPPHSSDEDRIAAWRKKNNIPVPESELNIKNDEKNIEEANARLKILELEQQIAELEQTIENKDFNR